MVLPERSLKASNIRGGRFVAFSDGVVLVPRPRVPVALLPAPQALMFVAVGDRRRLCGLFVPQRHSAAGGGCVLGGSGSVLRDCPGRGAGVPWV